LPLLWHLAFKIRKEFNLNVKLSGQQEKSKEKIANSGELARIQAYNQEKEKIIQVQTIASEEKTKLDEMITEKESSIYSKKHRHKAIGGRTKA